MLKVTIVFKKFLLIKTFSLVSPRENAKDMLVLLFVFSSVAGELVN